MSDARQQALSSPPARVSIAAPPPGQHGAELNPRPVRVRPPPPELAVGHAPGLDRRTVERLRRGRIPPQARMDLHQQTQQEARRLLDGFLAATQANGLRCVLVITGKGYGSGGVGVLKTMVPRWLNEPPNRARILAFCHAVPAQGGDGALYVLLRRSGTPKVR